MANVQTAIHVARRVLVAVVAAALTIASNARAQDECELSGKVLGKDGTPMAHLAVDVLGATNIYTETDDSGGFTVRIRAGTYVIRLRGGARREEFEQRVGPCTDPSSNHVDATFHLKW